MFFESWWRSLLKKFPIRPIRRKRSGASTVQMKVDVLEDRVVPANIYVVGPTAGDLLKITSTDPNRFSDGASSNTLHHVGANYTAANLRSAVAVAERLGGSNTILLDPGTYSLSSAYGGEIDVTTATGNALTIQSKTTALVTIERASGVPFRLFEVYGGGATALNYLQLEDGDAPQPTNGASIGGAILNHGKLSLLDDTFVDNQATGYGGGEGGAPQNGLGGAIYNDSGALLSVKNSTFKFNSTTGGAGNTENAFGGGAEGGAIFIADGSGAVSITATTFTGNSAAGGSGNSSDSGDGGFAYGGAVAVGYGGGNHITIVNSTFAYGGAYGGSGGGAYGSGGFATGGAISVLSGSTVTLVNDTIALNEVFGGSSGSYGSAGAAIGGGVANDGTIQIVNTIIAQNQAQGGDASLMPDDVNGDFTSLGHNLIGNADGSSGFNTSSPLDDRTGSASGAGILDPGLDPNGLQNNGGPTQTIALVVTTNEVNQAINNGDNGVVTGTLANGTTMSSLGIAPLTTDQRGTPYSREADSQVDIGAFEFQLDLNKTYTFKSSAKTSVTYTISEPAGLLQYITKFPPPTNYAYGVQVTEVGPGGESTTLLLNLNGSFNFTVPPGFTGTVEFEFELVLVPTEVGGPFVQANGPNQNKPRTTPTNLTFLVTFKITPGGSGRDLFFDL